jgi:ribonuclease P protein subunit POP4
MPMMKQNIMRHELIGLEARVMNSSDHTLLSTSGKVVDETRNMLVIDDGEKVRKISKYNSIFLITLPDGEKATVDGKKLVGRPEERVRRKR